MTELLDGDIATAAAALAAGDVSAVELCKAALDRVAAVQPTLNVAIHLRPEAALAQARAVDAARAAGGPLGPLAGIPMLHKDMYYRAGEVATCGSRLYRDRRATVTATVLERLDAAGTLDLGRLNMSEFAVGFTGHNIHHGDCRNPWDPAYITGGSSSGSGAVTAARCAFAALGSDTGGSVRLPATVNGVVGLKPTQSLISRAGAMPLSPSLDCVGPLARRVADVAAVVDVITGADPRDPTCSRRPAPRTLAAARLAARGDLTSLRIGVDSGFFDRQLHPEVADLLADARRVLAGLGAELVPVELPDLNPVAQLQRLLNGGEAAALHYAGLRDHFALYSPQVRARLLVGLAYPAVSTQLAAHVRASVTRVVIERAFDHCDVLHAATLAIPAPTLEETAAGDGPELANLMARIGRLTRPVNYLGLPALTVPMGFTTNGLPSGCQFIGRPFAEARLFHVAAAFEAATGWHRHRPPHAAPRVQG